MNWVGGLAHELQGTVRSVSPPALPFMENSLPIRKLGTLYFYKQHLASHWTSIYQGLSVYQATC